MSKIILLARTKPTRLYYERESLSVFALIRVLRGEKVKGIVIITAISGDLLSAVISIRYILGFRKDNPNVFSMLVQNSPITSGIKCICY
jgi:hypothetical protein